MSFAKRPVRPANLRNKSTFLEASDSDESSEGETTAIVHIGKRKRGDTSTFSASREPSVKEANVSAACPPKTSEKPANGDDGSKSVSLASKEPADIYRGLATYTTNAPKKSTAGPVRTSSTIRTVTFVDYQPDVCKDYKQTGYCGFGLSCKFLHDRSDYKAGWQIDRDWELQQQQRKKQGEDLESSPDDDDGLPQVCALCELPFRNPIVTQCRHYFCEECALKRYRKNPSCGKCSVSTHGVFKPAKVLMGQTKN